VFANPIIRFDCSRQYLVQLRDHQFQRELANKYKDKVFWDIEQELEVWRNQTKHDSRYYGHGYEYHAAIRIFEQYGYLSLVEKYGGHGKLRQGMYG
jgi:hypothetical protein